MPRPRPHPSLGVQTTKPWRHRHDDWDTEATPTYEEPTLWRCRTCNTYTLESPWSAPPEKRDGMKLAELMEANPDEPYDDWSIQAHWDAHKALTKKC